MLGWLIYLNNPANPCLDKYSRFYQHNQTKSGHKLNWILKMFMVKTNQSVRITSCKNNRCWQTDRLTKLTTVRLSYCCWDVYNSSTWCDLMCDNMGHTHSLPREYLVLSLSDYNQDNWRELLLIITCADIVDAGRDVNINSWTKQKQILTEHYYARENETGAYLGEMIF